MKLREALVVSAVVMLSAGSLARADLLVTRDGATLETSGSWRVEGRRVIFTLPNGMLSAIRTDEIDLDRSALATARAAEAAATAAVVPAPVALGEPILRLTEDDLSRGEPESLGEGADEGEGAKKTEAKKADEVPLKVVSWDKVPMPSGDGIGVYGTIRNSSRATITSPTIDLLIYGEDGGLLATAIGSINLSVIAAGKSANFRAEFPGLPDFSAIKFNIAGRGFETRSQEPVPEEEGAGAEAGEGLTAEQAYEANSKLRVGGAEQPAPRAESSPPAYPPSR